MKSSLEFFVNFRSHAWKLVKVFSVFPETLREILIESNESLNSRDWHVLSKSLVDVQVMDLS